MLAGLTGDASAEVFLSEGGGAGGVPGGAANRDLVFLDRRPQTRRGTPGEVRRGGDAGNTRAAFGETSRDENRRVGSRLFAHFPPRALFVL